MNAFIKKIEKLVNPIRNSRITAGCDLFIYPCDENQKSLLLNLSKSKEDNINIHVNKTKAETEIKGVIYGVPLEEPDEVITYLLKDQGVEEASRIFRLTPNGKEPTKTFILKFPLNRPSFIGSTARTYPIAPYIRKPTHCTKFWELGHTIGKCTNQERCKIFSESHPPTQKCISTPKCPNCSSPGHHGGSQNCTAKVFRQKVLDVASRLNVPFQVAKSKCSPLKPVQVDQPINNTTSNFQSDPIVNKSILMLRNQVESLQAQVNELKSKVDPIISLVEQVKQSQS